MSALGVCVPESMVSAVILGGLFNVEYRMSSAVGCRMWDVARYRNKRLADGSDATRANRTASVQPRMRGTVVRLDRSGSVCRVADRECEGALPPKPGAVVFQLREWLTMSSVGRGRAAVFVEREGLWMLRMKMTSSGQAVVVGWRRSPLKVPAESATDAGV
jgi:hypothetical protein